LTLFEYIAIAFSLVYSFTLLRLVSGLPSATRPGRIYWVHLVLLLTYLLWVVNWFWAFWSYRDAEWTYLRYILALSTPAAQYYVAVVFVPSEPSEVASWRDYYFSVRRRLFIGFGVAALLTDLTSTVLVGMPFDHPARLGTLGNLLAAIVGFRFEDPRVHGGLAVVAFLTVLAFGAMVLTLPGALR
jgi:hypothetical protein